MREIEALSLLTLRFYPLAFIALTLSTQTALKHRKKGFFEGNGFYTDKNSFFLQNMIKHTVRNVFRIIIIFFYFSLNDKNSPIFRFKKL